MAYRRKTRRTRRTTKLHGAALWAHQAKVRRDKARRTRKSTKTRRTRKNPTRRRLYGAALANHRRRLARLKRRRTTTKRVTRRNPSSRKAPAGKVWRKGHRSVTGKWVKGGWVKKPRRHRRSYR